MADRGFETPKCNILNQVNLLVLLQGQGAGKAPILSVGDPNAAWFSQPVYTSTGIWTIQTKDGFWGVAGVELFGMQASAAGTLTVFEQTLTKPDPTTTPAANLVTVTVNTRVSGSLADIDTTDYVRLRLALINSSAGYNMVDPGGDD